LQSAAKICFGSDSFPFLFSSRRRSVFIIVPRSKIKFLIEGERFFIAFHDKEWNEAKLPLRNLIAKGYQIGEP